MITNAGPPEARFFRGSAFCRPELGTFHIISGRGDDSQAFLQAADVRTYDLLGKTLIVQIIATAMGEQKISGFTPPLVETACVKFRFYCDSVYLLSLHERSPHVV